MINILLNCYSINQPWGYEPLKKYIVGKRVCVVGFSFRDSVVKDDSGWQEMYGKNGKYSSLIYSGLSGFGIKKRDITYVNYYKDSIETSKKKIADSTLLFFPGGLPDRLMDRLRERDLYDSVLNYQGEVIMGASAGAMIQLAEYHITPDSDYSEYSYCNGFPFIKDFDIEVHYEATRLQKECIARAIRDKGKPVYAVCNDGGIIIDNGIVTPFSKVRKYTKPPYIPKRKPKILE